MPNLTHTSTFSYLQFNRSTAQLPRFKPVQLFLDLATREVCMKAYNKAAEGTGIYFLHRFGEGAIPFDLIVKGLGRGTMRVVGRSVLVRFPSGDVTAGVLREPDAAALAEVIEARFGATAALAGKALMLPIMLCSEAVMALSETASAYLARSQQWVGDVSHSGIDLDLKPLLRLRYCTWDALRVVNASFILPEHIRDPMECRIASAQDFASKWRETVNEQRKFIEWLGAHPGYHDLITWLGDQNDEWKEPGHRFIEIRRALRENGQQIDELRSRIAHLEDERLELAVTIRRIEREIRRLKMERVKAAPDKVPGINEKRREAIQERQSFVDEIGRIRGEQREVAIEIQNQMKAAASATLRAEKARIQKRVDEERLRLARNALLLVRGVQRANDRPCAWWLPLFSPDGIWFREIARTTQAYFQPWPSHP